MEVLMLIRIFLSLIILFFGSFQVEAQSSLLKSSQKRDLSLYDKIGPFSMRLGEINGPITSQLREFLWEHWLNKRLGYVQATRYSKEGDANSYSYFIEPGEDSIWHVVIIVTRTLNNRMNPGKKPHIFNKLIVLSIERFEFPQDNKSLNKPIDKLDRRKADSYYIILRDVKGEMISKI